MTSPLRPPEVPGPEALGWSKLAFDAVLGLVGVVEAMHATIGSPFGTGGEARTLARTRGVTGFVYASVRGVARAAGHGVGAALSAAAAKVPPAPGSTRREAVRGALNGVVGDHLAATGNPLAIEMRLRRDGKALVLHREALAAALPSPCGQPLVLVHGLCMTDRGWLREGHDHGAALARDLGFTPVYLHYNTGLHVSINGRALADLLEALAGAWPVPVRRLTFVAHSMGGLVFRSAYAQAHAAGHAWPARVKDAVFLGTPHQGAPLERIGAYVHAALGVSRYSAPIAHLGRLRSAGITDLRHGSLLEAGGDRFSHRHPLPRPVPLPRGVRCFAVAGSTARRGGLPAHLVGDGLVPLGSALGRHAESARDLGFPEARRFVAHGTGHLELLSSPEVYGRLRSWLER